MLPETPSTNAVCADRARDGEPAGLVVTTEHQYAGRGRLDRVWEMPPRAALALSVLLRPDLPGARWPWLPLMTGVAVADTVGGRVKWPNDVLLGPGLRKVCGILVERIETGPKGAVLAFRDNTFANPEGLLRYIASQAPVAKVRPDMKVVFLEDWERPRERLSGTTKILRSLVKIAEARKAA